MSNYKNHERTFQTMYIAFKLTIILTLILILMGCNPFSVTQYYEKGSHPAQTEHEYYIEGMTWKYANELKVKLDRVHFADIPYTTSDGPSDGWTCNNEIWYWEDSVNSDKWTNENRNELAWHETCHLVSDSHDKKWCSCMTQKFLSVYCR